VSEVPPKGDSPDIGWFGKVPARGDFVCHGLPQDWVAPWDACLQQVLVLACTQGLWPLDFAPWRFLAWSQETDGQACDRAWAGVLVPSRDRVGRVFPLTVVQRLGRGRAPGPDWRGAEAALARLADAALDVTDTADPALTENFVSVLSELGPVFDSGLAFPPEVSGRGSLWWCAPAPGDMPQPLAQTWPPEPARLLALLSAPTNPLLASLPAAPGPAPRTPS
jgi:type VI secretion system protein ImpM